MAKLTVVGVRHHSPACARVVRHAIETLRPRFVLIEGPSDMNGRLDELRLKHRLPIAVYTYRLSEDGRGARATWAPFCEYSPEWVALRHGHASGSETLFIDLPAWDDAFAAVENRYSDAHLNVSSRLVEIAHTLGFDSTDTLWDHLFEQRADPLHLQAELAKYFDALRADEPPAPGDDRREAFMAQWIAWAMRQASEAEHVLVVCGGYHKLALERLWASAPTDPPQCDRPRDRVGSYLVPFSFRRMDSFAGYASGMPSPAFYQALWEDETGAAERMLWAAISRLRGKAQRVSTSDAIAVNQLMHGLAALRGHPSPLRADALDALAGALLKDALSRPPPWSSRGVLPAGTDPILVEVVATFSGDARGAVAPETPRPPLWADIERELRRVGMEWSEQESTWRLDVLARETEEQRRVLHRLRLLEVPEVERISAADLHRGVSRTEEEWRLRRVLESEPAVIERAVYGASLQQAALGRLTERVQHARGVPGLALALEDAILAGFEGFAGELATRAREAVATERSFAELGAALGRFLVVLRAVPQSREGIEALGAIALERALWLLESIDGPQLPFDQGEVFAVAAIRNWLRELHIDSEVLTRRASAEHAPPALRGACLGARWSLSPGAEETEAARVVRSIPDARLGDFLGGLFVLAREEFLGSSLLPAVHDRLEQMERDQFLAALPSLRLAFSFFPPRERLTIAKRVVSAARLEVQAHELLRRTFSPEVVQQAAQLEESIFRMIDTWGLLRRSDG